MQIIRNILGSNSQINVKWTDVRTNNSHFIGPRNFLGFKKISSNFKNIPCKLPKPLIGCIINGGGEEIWESLKFDPKLNGFKGIGDDFGKSKNLLSMVSRGSEDPLLKANAPFYNFLNATPPSWSRQNILNIKFQEFQRLFRKWDSHFWNV